MAEGATFLSPGGCDSGLLVSGSFVNPGGGAVGGDVFDESDFP